MTIRRLAVAGAALASALALSACSTKHSVVTHAETEGIYLDVGPLKYQVQNSRQLNPRAIPEDRTFVSGVSSQDLGLEAGEAWFAVFVRVENESKRAQPLARRFEIADSDGNVFRPLTIGEANPFRYAATTLRSGAVAPSPDEVAGQTSINGLELLFKVKLSSLEESRPLALRIHSATRPEAEAEVDLDI